MTDNVQQIGERTVQVFAQTVTSIGAIKVLGGTPSADVAMWRIEYDTEDELANILEHLRDADVAFSGGSSGWPPAAVAELLRDKGKFHGVFKEITWMGPGREVLQQR